MPPVKYEGDCPADRAVSAAGGQGAGARERARRKCSNPPTVRLPVPVSVPPLIVRSAFVVDADVIESVPPEIVKGSVEVKLLIVSSASSSARYQPRR